MQASSLSIYTPKPPASPLHPSPEPQVPLQVLFRQKLLTAFTRYFTAEKQLPPGWGHKVRSATKHCQQHPVQGRTSNLGVSDKFPALTKLAADDQNLHKVTAWTLGPEDTMPTKLPVRPS